jgi:hypothetical protein
VSGYAFGDLDELGDGPGFRKIDRPLVDPADLEKRQRLARGEFPR